MKIRVKTPIKYKGQRWEIGEIVNVSKKDEEELKSYGEIVKEPKKRKKKAKPKTELNKEE